MASFYALITTVDVPSGPPGWDTFPKPMPQPPLGTWGGGNVPFPTPPIYIPGPPLGTWGGAGQPFPTPPMYGPPYPPAVPGAVPTPPIFYPEPPLGTWGGGNVPFPTPPIVIPPDLPPTLPDSRPIDWKTAWTPSTGWVVVGIPSGPTPTPSAAKK
jgi:hypothetical protein